MQKGIVRYARLWLVLGLLVIALVAGAVIAPRNVRGQAKSPPPAAAPQGPAPAAGQDLASMLWYPCEGTPEPGAVLTVLQHGVDGYFGTEDTYLTPDSPDENFSDLWYMHLGYKGKDSGLIRFDLSPISPESHIICAALMLFPERYSAEPDYSIDVGAFRVLHPWVSTQATHQDAFAGEPWDAPGCDGAADRSFTAEHIETIFTVEEWYTLPMTSLVDGWVHGSAAPSQPGASQGSPAKASWCVAWVLTQGCRTRNAPTSML